MAAGTHEGRHDQATCGRTTSEEAGGTGTGPAPAGEGSEGAGAAGGGEGVLAPDVLTDLIRVVNAPGHQAWAAAVRRIGGCAHPLHMAGYTRWSDTRTGQILAEYTSATRPGGVVLVRCRNRRAVVCPPCSAIYHGDTFHLVRAGLLGGKGVPVTVTTHPRIFLTLTAPGFGAVHTTRTTRDGRPAPCLPRRTTRCPHGGQASCWQRHQDDDPALGAPLCPDCYDYPGAVIWQASLGLLWQRFTTYLPRHLAAAAGLTQREVRARVRLSYVKIVEYQRRGMVHIHAVIRADARPPADAPGDGGGPEPTVMPPPGWVTARLLEQAARGAAAAVRVRAPRHDPDQAPGWLTWGQQTDVQDITLPLTEPDGGGVPGEGERAGRRIALYVAKYATKGTEITGWTGHSTDGTARAAHAERMVTTALDLAPVPELAALNLGRWARHLAYRGHVASKSRRYSTTMSALRAARAAHARGSDTAPGAATRNGTDGPGMDGGGRDGEGVLVESSWRLAGHGYTPGQALLAASVARDAAINRAASRDAGAAPPGGWVGPHEASAAPDVSGARVPRSTVITSGGDE